MAGWTCDGIPKDGQQHPEQHTPGKHETYENFGKDCVICGLSKEAITSGSKPPVKAIAFAVTALVLTALGGIAYLVLPKPCPSGQQRVGDSCQLIAVDPTPPSPPVSPLPTSPSPASTPTPGVSPAPPTTTYRTFVEVPGVPQIRVRYGGSTSFAPLRSPTIVQRILQAHPGFELIYTEPPPGENPGSGSGIRMLLEGQLAVAQSSRPLEPEEHEEARTRNFILEQVPVAIDGIALYVNSQVNVPGLSVSQIKDIYTGRLTNWREVGGPDLPIVPFSRDPNDGGTPQYFVEKILQDEPMSLPVDYVRDTTTSIRSVASTLGGLGYATASEVCNQETLVRPLPISKEANQAFVNPCIGVQVNQASFADDSYAITRRLFIIIRRDGTLDEQAGVAYVNLLLSDEGQQIVRESGLVPIR